MHRRHPEIPRLWLMTDERMGAGLWTALERLPRGGGVVFRHHGLAPAERASLFGAVAKVARGRRLRLVVAGKQRLGNGTFGTHNKRASRRGLLNTASAHNRREALRAVRRGADLLFVSPLFPTRSHPGARALGRIGLRRIIHGLKIPVIALGGMDAARARSLRGLGIHGWAGIDAWTGAENGRRSPLSRG